MKRVPALDGLRGLAALVVVANHTTHVYFGREAVDVFLALSGFLVGGGLLDSCDSPGWYHDFFWRRAARIWPLYCVVMLLLALTGAALHTVPVMWLPILTFTSNFVPQHREPARVLWSISLEEQIYILLPLLVFLFRRQLVPLLIVAAAWSFHIREHGNMDVVTMPINQLLGHLDCAALGMLAAAFLRDLPEMSIRHPTAWLVFAVTLTTATGVWASLLILFLARGSLPGATRVLSLAPLRWLGEISFGVYVLHSFPAERLDLIGVRRGWPLFLGTAAPTLLLAHASHFYFEVPVQRWIRRITARRAESSESPVGVP